MTNIREYLDTILIIIGVFAFYQFLGLALGTPNPVDVVVSSSMHPNLYEGDLIICAKDEPKINDIVIYHSKLPLFQRKYPIIHRIIEVNSSYCRGDNPHNIKIPTGSCYTIKGDNARTKDPVKKDQILCVVKAKIPYVGYPRYLIYKIFGI